MNYYAPFQSYAQNANTPWCQSPANATTAIRPVTDMTQLSMDLGPDTTLEMAQWHCRWASEHLIIDPDYEPEQQQDDRTCVPKHWYEEVER